MPTVRTAYLLDDWDWFKWEPTDAEFADDVPPFLLDQTGIDSIWGPSALIRAYEPIDRKWFKPTWEVQPLITAYVMTSFSSDMYNRIWFLADHPDGDDYAVFVDFGIILRPVTRYFRIWNAYLDRPYVTCTGITYSDNTQFEVHGPNDATPPWILETNGFREYDAVAYEDGDFEFRVTVTWSFSEAIIPNTVDGLFIGTRATILTYPALDRTMKERLEWSTEVSESNSGKEQRIRLRQEPRQFIQYNFYVPNEAKMSHIEGLLYQWSKRAWGVPFWGEAVAYDGSLPSGTTSVVFDTGNASFAEGSLVLFWQGIDRYSISQIDSIDLFTDTVTLELALTTSFTGRTFILPIKSAFMDKPAQINYSADGQATVKASFAVIAPEEIDTAYSPIDSLAEDNSSGAVDLPLIHEGHIVSKTQKITVDGDNKIIDFNTGKFAIYSDSEYVKSIQGVRWRKETKESVWELRKFYHYLKGKWKSMWLPTHREDMTLAFPFTADTEDVTIIVNEKDISDMYGTNNNRRALHFQRNDGEYTYALVTSIALNPDETVTLNLSPKVGMDITSSNTIISWLDKVRLVSDSVKMDWELVGRLESKIKVMRVED